MTITLLLFFLTTFAQTPSIEVICDPRVDTLVSRYTLVHYKKASIEGFRIQITANTNRSPVFQMKSQFQGLFPEIKTFQIYQSPNFKLRVGSYRTRLEAYRDLQRILPKFPGAFIVKEEIKLSEL